MGKMSYEHEGLSISVEFDRYTFADRCAWTYVISDTQAGEVLHKGTDLETTKYDMVDALRSLHSFLSAWNESMRYPLDGGSVNLFPRHLHDRLHWSSWLDYAYGDFHGEDDR